MSPSGIPVREAQLYLGHLRSLLDGHDKRRRSGRSAEENAVGAYRHLWTYLVEKGYAPDNVAVGCAAPPAHPWRQRGYRIERRSRMLWLSDHLTTGILRSSGGAILAVEQDHWDLSGRGRLIVGEVRDRFGVAR